MRELKPLTLKDVLTALRWRNAEWVRPMLRTSYPLTVEQQGAFYHNSVCNRTADSRWWGAWDNDTYIAMVGLTGIQRENRIAEISYLPSMTFDEETLDALLAVAKNELNLKTVYAEVYECSPFFEHWSKYASRKHAYMVGLPSRKYWKGLYYGSLYLSFNVEAINDQTV
jgi:RimJ/RimL family protein N-acetyltransferase